MSRSVLHSNREVTCVKREEEGIGVCCSLTHVVEGKESLTQRTAHAQQNGISLSTRLQSLHETRRESVLLFLLIKNTQFIKSGISQSCFCLRGEKQVSSVASCSRSCSRFLCIIICGSIFRSQQKEATLSFLTPTSGRRWGRKRREH